MQVKLLVMAKPRSQLAAGIISFLSPCVLPLVPPYLVYLAGSSLERLADAEPEPQVRRETVMAALLFVCGFSTVFVALGASASVISVIEENDMWNTGPGISTTSVAFNPPIFPALLKPSRSPLSPPSPVPPRGAHRGRAYRRSRAEGPAQARAFLQRHCTALVSGGRDPELTAALRTLEPAARTAAHAAALRLRHVMYIAAPCPNRCRRHR